MQENDTFYGSHMGIFTSLVKLLCNGVKFYIIIKLDTIEGYKNMLSVYYILKNINKIV